MLKNPHLCNSQSAGFTAGQLSRGDYKIVRISEKHGTYVYFLTSPHPCESLVHWQHKLVVAGMFSNAIEGLQVLPILSSTSATSLVVAWMIELSCEHAWLRWDGIAMYLRSVISTVNRWEWNLRGTQRPTKTRRLLLHLCWNRICTFCMNATSSCCVAFRGVCGPIAKTQGKKNRASVSRNYTILVSVKIGKLHAWGALLHAESAHHTMRITCLLSIPHGDSRTQMCGQS